METGFLNPIQDEEQFSSTFYNQPNVLDDSEHVLFGEMIVPEIIDYDNLWQSVDDTGTSSHSDESKIQKEDFQKMLSEWQHQLTCMQESEVIKQIIPVAEATEHEISEMFTNKTCSVPSDPFIEDLFPQECRKEILEIPFLETKSEIKDLGADSLKLKETAETSEQILALNVKNEIYQEKLVKNLVPKIKQECVVYPRLKSEGRDQAAFSVEVHDVKTSTGFLKQELVSPLSETEEQVVKEILRNENSVHQEQLTKPLIPKMKREPILSLDENKMDSREDPVLDIGTITGELPLLMAQDLNSLLEQFEATEKVTAPEPTPASRSPMPSPPRPSSKTIRDALPAEVINRIKATRENHKKMIALIPAMPTKKPTKTATRMQDAGVTLSRNKLLKLITGGSGGETVTVQLDHDYCSGNGGTDGSRSSSFYATDSSEYPSQSSTPDGTCSRQPDFYKRKERLRTVDSGSRKDSGLESGENSEDDTPPTMMTSQVMIDSGTGLRSISVLTEKGVILGSNCRVPVKKQNVPMVSVLKKNNVVKVEEKKSSVSSAIQVTESESLSLSAPCSPSDAFAASSDASRKKKKLNLEEYRNRREERDKIRSQESSRANSPVPCETPPAQPDSTTASLLEGVAKDKPLMMSVEVQTQTCDFVDLTSPTPSQSQKRARMERKEKRNDLKQRSYRTHHSRSSSSSSSAVSNHCQSSRRRRSRRRSRTRRNSVSRMWSRSPSSSSSSSRSPDSRSKSRERRRRISRSPRRSSSGRRSHHSETRQLHRRSSFGRDRSWQRQRSRSPIRSSRHEEFNSQEKVRQVEERRVIYVGRIKEGTTKADLRRRFQPFGPIVDISVHFRERGDNYGFVTFAYKTDAYQAVEHGNDDTRLPHYDLCFGGRRAFCKQRYADLDGIANARNQYEGPMSSHSQPGGNSFDLLLHEVKSKLLKRSNV